MGPRAMPCSNRKNTSMGRLVARPQPIDDTTKPTMMATNRLRFPITAPSQPRMGIIRVRVMRKPVVTHCVVARSVPNAAISRGMARFTLFPANVWVPPATRTMAATSHL